MNAWIEAMAYWLADFYLAATVLFVAALVAMRMCRQPAERLAVAKAAIVAAALLAGLCALPGWSIFSLGGVSANEATNIKGLPPATAIAELPRGLEMDPLPRATPALSQVASLPAETTWEIPWLSVIVGSYLVGSAAIVVWLTVGAIAAARLVKRAEDSPDELRRALSEAAGLGELLVSNEIDVPVALGIFRPRVMLPREWIETRTPSELKTVLAHEAAHIRNRDLQWLAASRLLLVTLWAQPLYWWLRRQMRLDQETLADAAAAEVAGRQAYAEQMVEWARDVVARPRPLLPASVGLWEGASQLRRRVAVLLDETFAILPKTTASWRRGVVGVAVVLAILLSLLSLAPVRRSGAAFIQKTAGEIESAIQQSLEEYPRVSLRSGSLAIDGRCVDEDGKSLDSADVALLYFNFKQSTYGLVGIEKVDLRGEFKFRGLELPTQEEEGYVTYWLVAWSPGRASGVTNLIPELPRNITFKLSPAEAITGRVRDEAGNPVAGALVRFDHLPFAGIEGILCSRTDANGDFAVTDLARLRPESLVKVLGSGMREIHNLTFDVEHSQFANASVRYDQVPGEIDVVLKPASVIRGRVVYEGTNQPAPNARVSLQDVSHQDQNLKDPPTNWAEAVTDGEGRFALKNLRAGKYNVWASADDWTMVALDSFQVGVGEERTAPDIELVKGGFLAGRLVDADTGENVSIGKDDGYVSVGVYGPSRPRSGAAIDGGRVNADGTFRFRLPPGEHYVYLSSVGEFEVEGKERGARQVRIRDDEQTKTEFRVRRSISDSSTSVGSDGSNQNTAVRSEEDRFKEAIEGAQPEPTQHQSIDGGDVMQADSEPDGTVRSAAVLKGRVVEFSTGEPVANFIVKVAGVPFGASPPALMLSADGLVSSDVNRASTRTDSEGRYQFTELPAGEYTVWAESPIGDITKGGSVCRGVEDVRVGESDVPTNVPLLKIGPGATVYGRLVDGDTGEPLSVAGRGVTLRAISWLSKGSMLQLLPVQHVPVSAAGTFEIRAYPGESEMIVTVQEEELFANRLKMIYRSDDTGLQSRNVLNVKHGESIEEKFPVWRLELLDRRNERRQAAYAYFKPGKYAQAVEAFTQQIAVDPRDPSLLMGRSLANEYDGRWREAIADCEQFLVMRPASDSQKVHLADLLATVPEATLRDGRRALSLADESLAAGRDPYALQALAAAQAEMGNFKAAAATLREAIEKVPEVMRAEMRKRLEAYEGGKAWRREATASVAE